MMENKTKIDLKNKSIFITGVAGFIGSNLAKRLFSTVEGVKVVGLDNMNNYYEYAYVPVLRRGHQTPCQRQPQDWRNQS